MINQGSGEVASVDLINVMLVRALLTARDILLKELQKLSKAVDQAIEISEFVSKMNNVKLLNFVSQANQFATDVEISAQGKPQNGLKVLTFIHIVKVLLFCFYVFVLFNAYFILILLSLHVQGINGALDFLIAEKLHSLSKSELLDCCHLVGDQLLYLWNIFLKFHRFASYHVLLKFNKNVFFTSEPD